ncbi:MAG: recombinase family protein [Bacteroides sp.]|nr:recombinase family protein [Eubacterium sp.]MCM1417530.1 recombinase family protein [Roseburia sp.]MCM1462565.1 recombinase family protein [Bacteroides sp.]
MIALYIRLSLEDEKYDSLSIENQQILLREKAMSLPEYATSEVKEFVDNGHTGTNFERPAVQQLLEMVRAGKVSTILVKDLSRFGRNSIETGYFIEKVFPLYHVRFIAISDNFDTAEHKGETGGIEIAFKYLINEYYSRDLSIKSRTARMAKMRRGEYQSIICPYGYQKGANGRMIPDEETAENVRRIFEWAAQGLSSDEIVRKLYELGIPTPAEHKASKGKHYHDISRTNGVWCPNTVLNILADERYIGTYIIGKTSVVEVGSTHIRKKDRSEWIVIPNHHEPIISQELFDRANGNIKRYKLKNKQPREYLLRGKVYCGCCDHAMNLTNGRHFKCRHSAKLPDMPCNGLSIPRDDLERVVFDTINAQVKCVFGVGDLQTDTVLNTALEEEHEKKIRFLQDSKRELYEQYVLGELDAETYKAKKAELDVKLTYERNVRAAVAEQAQAEREEHENAQRRKKIADELQAADGLTKSLVGLLIKRVYVFPDNRIEIEYLSRSFF